MTPERPVPVLAFDTDSPEFIRGVEVGLTWALSQTEAEFVVTVHASNVEMMLRIAEASGCQVRSEDVENEWMFVQFHREAL